MTHLVIVSAREMSKLLLAIGFRAERQKGSHVFYRHPDGRTTTVPVHPSEQLDRRLMRKILNDINMELEDFEKLRRSV